MSKTEHILSHYDPAVLEMGRALKLAQESGASAEVIESIKTALELVDLREKFTDFVTSDASEACNKILKETYEHDWKTLKAEGKTNWMLKPVMMTGPLEGQFLKSLVSIQNAKRVLDIGMFTGYSALSMAEALPADGKLVTVDTEKYLGTYTGSLLKESEHSKKIEIFIGSATNYMRERAKEGQTFDMIFLDADKSEYQDYLKVAFEEGLLSPRGTVMVDNAYRHGAGYVPSAGDNSTKQLAEAVAANNSLHSVLVPLRDGVILLRRKTEVQGGVPQ